MNAVNPYYNPYSEREKDILKLAWADNLPDQAAQEILKLSGFDRTLTSIKTQRCRLKLVREWGSWTKRKDTTWSEGTNIQTARQKLVSADLAFKRAMLAAIKSGEEKAVLGVCKDRRPWSLKIYQPEPIASGSSSPESWV